MLSRTDIYKNNFKNRKHTKKKEYKLYVIKKIKAPLVHTFLGSREAVSASPEPRKLCTSGSLIFTIKLFTIFFSTSFTFKVKKKKAKKKQKKTR